MVVPRLIHPVPVQFRSTNVGATHYDNQAREAVQQTVEDTAVDLVGQVSYVNDSRGGRRRTISDAGASEDDSGYVLFRLRDLEEKGVNPKMGDRFVKIGKRDVDYYVTRQQDMGHYGDQSGGTLVRVVVPPYAAAR